jgi:TfoX/Sxy family transcriptional regulator of competence genes
MSPQARMLSVMSYDEDLAARARDELVQHGDYTEKKMFGGLAFMVNTHMACGIVGADLMVRVGKDNHDGAIGRGAIEMEFTGGPMRGMVIVPGPAVADPVRLAEWVATAVAFARSEPAKAPRAADRRSSAKQQRGS